MKEFTELFNILKKLLGPGGCPWDQKQTLETLRKHVLEEVYELIEAIDFNENEMIKEELGDLFFNVLFFCLVGEKEKRFTTEEVLDEISQKLVRRHPHVFGETKVKDAEEVLKRWEEIKRTEKKKHERKSLLDGIPKDLPSLARGQKIFQKLKKVDYPIEFERKFDQGWKSKEELGEEICHLLYKAEELGFDAELICRETLDNFSNRFKEWEKSNA